MNARSLFLVALIFGGCKGSDRVQEQTAERCTPAALGLIGTASGVAWLDSAVTKANALLAPDGKYALVRNPPASPAETSRTVIPLYAVGPSGLAPMRTTFVPSGCRVVVVQTAALAARLVEWNGDTATGLQVDRTAMVAWLLLHEVGHVQEGDSGAYEPVSAVRGANFADTPDKKRELAADAFAAHLVKRAGPGSPSDAFLAAMSVSMAFSNLSWNLQRDRQLGHFGSTVLASPDVFGDLGETHPNLELRALITLQLITGTDGSRKLLEDFMALRKRASAGARP